MKVLKIQEDVYVMVSDISCFTIDYDAPPYSILVHCIYEPSGYIYECYEERKDAEIALAELVTRIGTVIE